MSRYGNRDKDDLYDAVFYGMSDALRRDMPIKEILNIVFEAVQNWIIDNMI